ncbi:hypothetical protein [Vibrio hyugaensis]|uniref:hypothetical protein n=1 Tax=Vibrio hyugaensis TaxID=1534743 RepID=UPI000CE56AB2|nr:hypothetical protein [Vibrio hyugaensis]
MPKFFKFGKKKKAKSSSGGGYKPVEVVTETAQSSLVAPTVCEPLFQSQCRLKIHCSKDELNSLNVGVFKLGKTDCETSPDNKWSRNEVDSLNTVLITKCKKQELKKLYYSFFNSSLHEVQFTIKMSPLNNDCFQAEFVPVKLAVEVFKERLAWPTTGYFYHFVDGELYNEYKVVGEGKWSLQVTLSRGCRLSDDLVSEQHITSVLLPYKIEGQIYGVQHFLYQKCKLTQDILDDVDTNWLKGYASEVCVQDVIDIREPLNYVETPRFENVVLLGDLNGEYKTRKPSHDTVNIYKDNSVSNRVPVLKITSLWKGKRRVPQKIHFFWHGGFSYLKKHLANIESTARYNPAYKVILHVLPNEGECIDDLKKQLNRRHVQVQDVNGEAWFINFKDKPRYRQFEASRIGRRRHLASGADIIKSELLAIEGGVWNDVDNPPLKSLPEQLLLNEGDILTAGPVIFKRWGNIKGVHSSSLATHQNNLVLQSFNDSSFAKYRASENIIYQECKETDNPDQHFKLISETAGSLHFSKELFAVSEGFEMEVDELLKKKEKYNMKRVILDEYFKPTTNTGAGELDDAQVLALVGMLSAPGHVAI